MSIKNYVCIRFILFLSLLGFALQFLNALKDNDGHVRSALRKLLKLVKLPDLVTFQLSFNGLLESLESYPQVFDLSWSIPCIPSSFMLLFLISIFFLLCQFLSRNRIYIQHNFKLIDMPLSTSLIARMSLMCSLCCFIWVRII